jgi:hypothetical protein
MVWGDTTAAALGFGQMSNPAVAVSAVGGQLTMAATAGGSGTNYPYSLTITYDSGDFSSPSFSTCASPKCHPGAKST